MFSIKALVFAAAVSGSVALVMPAPSQAMPLTAPVKIDAVNNGNLTQVYYRHHHHRYYHRHYYRPYYGIGIRIWPPLCIGFC